MNVTFSNILISVTRISLIYYKHFLIFLEDDCLKSLNSYLLCACYRTHILHSTCLCFIQKSQAMTRGFPNNNNGDDIIMSRGYIRKHIQKPHHTYIYWWHSEFKGPSLHYRQRLSNQIQG